MATPAGVLSILVRANTSNANLGLAKVNAQARMTAARFGEVDTASSKTQRSLRTVGRAATLAAGGGLVLLGVAAKKAFGEFEESEKATKQTEAVIKSTGNAAKTTAAQIEELANQISLKSGIDDEAIQSGENLLLTFTKIRNETGKGNDIFDRSTQVITDMSVALGTSLKSSAIQVGKALQDPEKGITALRRVGVSFTTTQQDMITKWAQHGETLKAQRFILRELTKEFGGSAAAQATSSAKLRTAFNNLLETFGKAFGPTLEKAMASIARFINQMQTGEGAGGRFARVMKLVGRGIVELVVSFQHLGRWIKNAVHNMDTFGDNARHVIFAIGHWFSDKFNDIKRIFGNVMAAIFRGFAKLFEQAAKLPFVGGKFKDLAEKANAAANKVDRLGEAVRNVPSKKEIDLMVNVALGDLAAGKVPKLRQNLGDPKTRLEKAIAQQGAKGGRKLLAQQGDDIAALLAPAGGRPQGGTLGKAGKLADLFGLRISSTYRSPSHNAAVGGVPGSLHTHGSPSNPGATDLVGSIGSMMKARAYAISHWHPLEALIHDAGSGLHLHLGWFAKGGKAARQQMAVVGEQGPEIVSLPAGAEVFSHSKSRSMVDRMAGMLPGFAGGGTVKPEYRRLIQMASKRYGIPARILAGLIDVESGWNPNAVSPAGAFGLTQFMPGTAAGYGVARGSGHHAVATQILGAAHYLKDLGFARNRSFALGAYNGGPGNPQYGYANAVMSAAAGYRGIGAAVKKAKHHIKKVAKKVRDRKHGNPNNAGDVLATFMNAASERLDMGAALAALTPGTADDIANAFEAVQVWTSMLDWAKQNNNAAGITTAAQNLKAARDTIADLTAPVDAPVDQSDRVALLSQLLTEANLRTGVSQAQYGVFAGMPAVGSSGFASGGSVQPIVNVHLSGNASLLERFIDRRIEQKTRTSRSASLPGRGGGLQR